MNLSRLAPTLYGFTAAVAVGAALIIGTAPSSTVSGTPSIVPGECASQGMFNCHAALDTSQVQDRRGDMSLSQAAVNYAGGDTSDSVRRILGESNATMLGPLALLSEYGTDCGWSAHEYLGTGVWTAQMSPCLEQGDPGTYALDRIAGRI
jgi:hypothetical protein